MAMRRTAGTGALALALVACAMILGVPNGAEAQSGVCARENAQFDRGAEGELRRLTNAVRRRHGVGRVRARAALTRQARSHTKKMARIGVMRHSNGGGRFPWAGRRAAGENLALAASPREAIDLLMESPSHRRTMLSRNFRTFGIGALRTCTGHLLITQNFLGR